MRKILVALFVSLSFILVGCSDSDTGGGTGYDSNSISDRKALYLDLMREEIPEARNVSDSLLLDSADAVCDLFDAGGEFEDAFFIYTESGLTIHQAGTLIGGAIGYKCPEHKGVLN